jgi:methionine synthase II (cobalamin-independent)
MTDRGWIAVRTVLTVIVAAGLAIDAYVHLDLASTYDVVKTSTLSQGDLFRVEAVLAIVDGWASAVWDTGITFGIHICRGNHRSMFYASGGYDRIAQQVFGRANFDRFLLEYDDERSGTFEPLRHVPADRTVVLGLVSTKLPALESESALEARVAEAARIVPLDRLALSPQCGFASTHEGNRLSMDDQRRKLELVACTSRAIWGEP